MSRVVHFEIPADDPKRAIKFYEDVFGWKIEKWGEFEYWLVTTGEEEEPGINGAILPKKFNGVVRDAISVDSYREAVKKIEYAGGKMLTEAMPVEGIGITGAFEDTEGNQFLIVASKE
jgi:predicted enzyme related to lactoylglutathione lyase